MWFIKLDDDITLEEVCVATGLEPKATVNPLKENVLNIVLKMTDSSLVFTNITLSFDQAALMLKPDGTPYGELDKDTKSISLFINEDNYVLADTLMDIFYDYGLRATMAKM